MGSDIDGYGVGTDLRIDYFLPGSPEERWAVGFKESGTVYNGGFSRLADDGGNLSLSGNSVVDESSGSNLKARFIGIVRKGGVNWIKVTQVHSFHESDLTFKTTVTLENVSGSNISDLRFMRSFDPDNTVNFSGGGSYTTTNQVVKTVLSSGYTLVTARNTASDTAYTIAAGKRSLVGFYSGDSRSYGFFGGFSNNDPFSIGGTDPVSSPKTEGQAQEEDQAIQIVFDVGSLAAGASTSFDLQTVLSQSAVPPTISAISAQTTSKDTATGAIAFTVGHVETAATALTVTATSSNQALVATNGIVLGGSGANRTITLTPAANASGTSTITVTVAEPGGLTATRTFALTVNAKVELLVNPHFALLDPANPLKSLAWDSTVGWVVFSGTGGNDVPPAVVANGSTDRFLAFGRSPSVVVSQTVPVFPVSSSAVDSFILEYDVTRNQQNGIYSVRAEFLSASGTVLATLRRPTSGTEAAPSAWTTNQLALNRGSLANFDQITQARVSVFGQQSPYLWSGHYGPLFNYVSLSAVLLPNIAPTISEISAQTTSEDTATGAIAFTVGDVETPVASLTVTATSSNQALVATAGIALGGSGTNRTITLTPVANASGTSTITVTVADPGGLTVVRTFVLTVTAVNDTPTLAGATNATISELAGYTQNLVPGDVDIPVQPLTVTLLSGPTGLVVTNGVLAWTPTEEQGPSTNEITATVTDGLGTATRTLVLTVTELNDVPTISGISDQTTLEDTATSAIAFTVGDVETAAGSLSVTATSSNLGVVATNGIALGGSGGNRTITLSPVANASGTSTITVTVIDGSGGSATRSFALTVSAVNDVPTISAISDQTTPEDTATSAIAFTVGDLETSAGSLTVTATSSNLSVVAAGGIALGGSGTNRTITLTPVANASGTNTITVTVTDGSGGSATRSFVLIVTPVPDVQTLEGFLLGAGLMSVVGDGGRYRLEASLGQAIAGSLPKVGSLDLASGFWFLDRLADALPGKLGDIPTPAEAAKGLVLQRATVAASRTDRLSSGTAPQMASGVRLPEARIRVAAVGDTAKVRILVSGLPKARWRVHSREGFGAGSWRDDGILQLDGEGEGFLETSGGDASAMRFYRLVQP